MGSPPQVRGKLQKNEYGDDILGITPADAGKTSLKYCRWKEEQDHPRGCGENAGASRTVGYPTGSPPRMRGKRSFSSADSTPSGITPADAGKTRHTRRRDRARQDHPRGCGENYRRVKRNRLNRGSPPRMRGKRATDELTQDETRITPADAGKTRLELHENILDKDHPRGCGENFEKRLTR